MNTQDRITLAEAMGWTPLDLNLTGWWMPPGATIDDHPFIIERRWVDDLPDPFTSADDCEALIKHLNGLGLELCIVHGIGYARVLLSGGKERDKTFKPLKIGEQGDECDNWKQGVCELALKVLK